MNLDNRSDLLSVKSVLRRLLATAIGQFDYELKVKSAPLRAPVEFFSWLVNEGFQPRTVFDVGVANGTPWLYEAFPQSYFVLVEANEEFQPALIETCERQRGEYHIFCAGARPSEGIFLVNENLKSSSGLLPVSEEYRDILAKKKSVSVNERESRIEIRPLDDLLSKQMKTPFLLKLDVEGYEIEVLKGASQILANTDMIVAEVSVVQRFEGEARFAEFTKFLDSIGFELFDIVDLSQLERNGRLTYLDAAFVRRGSPLEKL